MRNKGNFLKRGSMIHNRVETRDPDVSGIKTIMTEKTPKQSRFPSAVLSQNNDMFGRRDFKADPVENGLRAERLGGILDLDHGCLTQVF